MATATEITATVLEGRAEMESLMLDRCRITKPGPGGKGELDETTGQYPDEAERVVVYEGKCRLQVKADINANVVETTAGEREWTYLTLTLQLPIDPDTTDPDLVGSPQDVRSDNVAEMLECPLDASIVGRLLNIQGIYHKSQATHRRFRARELIQ